MAVKSIHLVGHSFCVLASESMMTEVFMIQKHLGTLFQNYVCFLLFTDDNEENNLSSDDEALEDYLPLAVYRKTVGFLILYYS